MASLCPSRRWRSLAYAVILPSASSADRERWPRSTIEHRLSACVKCSRYVKPSNHIDHRRDRRKLANQSGKRKCVTVMRERNGRTRPFVCSEREGASLATNIIGPGSVVFADQAKDYDQLHAIFEVERIDHSKSYAEGEISTNQAESYHARMRRSEKGRRAGRLPCRHDRRQLHPVRV